MHLHWICGAALTLSLTASTPLFAQAKESKASEAKLQQELKEMKEHFKAGQTHYSLGEFPEAAAEFREAYRIHNEPAILFNIAQAMRQMNDYRHAYFYYSQYLSQRPDAVNRSEVEQFMDAMKKKMDQEELAKSPEIAPQNPLGTPEGAPAGGAPASNPPGAAPSAGGAQVATAPPGSTDTRAADPRAAPAIAVIASPPPRADATFWTTPHIAAAGAGGVAIALGAVALVEHAGAVSSADTLNQKYQQGTLTTADAGLKDDVQSKGRIATVCTVAAVAALAAGAVLVAAF